MFKIQCDEIRQVDGKPFGVGNYIELVTNAHPLFARSVAALKAAVRIQAKPLAIESADMAFLREAINNPGEQGFVLRPAVLNAPFVNAILDAKEE